MPLPTFFKDKKIFLTGHTGFKGSWLLRMLCLMGAEVKGYSLAPENDSDLYVQMDGDKFCTHSVIADIRDRHLLAREIVTFEPDCIIHLAAQALVRRSYEQPVATFETNVLGTVNVLDAMRILPNPCAGLMITTDKVYENLENGRAFVESDKLGGHDPYSSSKAAAELAIAGYRKSYFSPQTYNTHHKAIVALRAGNVIGGGDFSEDRIIPDIVRSIQRNETVKLRHPKAVRPWQHVLEPLSAYLKVAEKLMTNARFSMAPAYNIGPDSSEVLDVESVTQKFIKYYGVGAYEIASDLKNVHEAGTLILDNKAIKEQTDWRPKYSTDEAIRITAQWYADNKQPAAEKMKRQILDYYQ